MAPSCTSRFCREKGELVDETRGKDLDETRRLLYGCLVASRTARWEVVGTVVNALMHHGPSLARADRPASGLLDALVGLVEDGATAREATAEFVYAEIGRITRALESSADTAALDVPPDPAE